MPTILAELGFSAPQSLDGIANGGRGKAALSYERTLVNGAKTWHPPNDLAELQGQRWWPAKPPLDIRLPPFAELVNSDCGRAKSISVQGAEFYADAQPEKFLAAHLLIKGTGDSAEDLLVRFNDVVHPVYSTGLDDASAFLDPALFLPGHNRLEVAVKGEAGWCLAFHNLVAP